MTDDINDKLQDAEVEIAMAMGCLAWAQKMTKGEYNSHIYDHLNDRIKGLADALDTIKAVRNCIESPEDPMVEEDLEAGDTEVGMTFSERLKARRHDLGLSLDDVAKAIGVNRSTLARYENGGIEKLPACVIDPLAKTLKISCECLMSWLNTTRDKQ
ncbi:MAG: helix-turn-helix transcriptional regulator [Erysipelotrichaceae bacterium]|nr:helix-turn-helix transcriptional regulator [Erysipelotrichaceae bacterium]